MSHSAGPARPDRIYINNFKQTVVLSLAVLACAYAIGLTDLGFTGKTAAFAGLIAAYLAAAWILNRRETAVSNTKRLEFERSEERNRAIELLQEACTVFGGSLGLADAFRLAASRITNICRAESVRLYLLDTERSHLQVAHATGADVGLAMGKSVELGEGTVGRACESGSVDVHDDLIAIPLFNGSHTFGVVEVIGATEPQSVKVLDQVGASCSRLILSAITKDMARENALVDATTDFPNERALRIVLENQTAEAQRERGDRALTVLAVDIKSFEELNKAFGHAAGDRVLRFAASTIKDNLRAMDFIARSRDDEFLILLPTADAGTSREVIDRISGAFVGHKIVINDTQAREVSLNIGAAAFGIDGETPQQLIGMARLRKQESKMAGSAKVLTFPHEPSGLLN